MTGETDLNWRNLKIVEQQIPGSPIDENFEEEERGLPDLWIFEGEWSLIIENKVMAPVSVDQLRRHRGMAKRNAFKSVKLAVLSPELPKRIVPWVIYRTWPDVFCWMRKQAKHSLWAGYLSEYLQVAEDRMTKELYLGDISLTEFDGIPFNSDHPFTYREAKRVLKLAMTELRKRSDLRKFRINNSQSGRKAITGSQGRGVWDFIQLKAFDIDAGFTGSPHLTLVIELHRVLAIVSIPNGVKAKMRSKLIELGTDGFADLSRQICTNVERAIRHIKGAYPFMAVSQRHYLSQNSPSIPDARLEFDLRTIDGKKSARVKCQPEWIDAAYAALANKRSNLHAEWGAVLQYQDAKMQSSHMLNSRPQFSNS